MNNTSKVQRAIHNLTQEQLASLVEVSRQTINAIELKKFVPSTVLALKIAKVFKTNIENIFQLEESE